MKGIGHSNAQIACCLPVKLDLEFFGTLDEERMFYRRRTP